MTKKTGGSSAARDLTFDRGLPSSVEAEKLVLGTIQIDKTAYPVAANLLKVEDFSLQKHQLIFSSMQRLSEKGQPIDRITVAHDLMRTGNLEAVDGLTYLSSLDDALPQIYNLEAYVQIIREKSLLRRTIYQATSIVERAMLDNEDPAELIPSAASQMIELAADAQPPGIAGPQQLEQFLTHYDGGLSTFLDPTRRKAGLMTALHWIDECTGGLRPGELITITGLTGSGKSALASNIAGKVAIKDKLPVVIFSLEMSKEMLFTRMACAEGRVDQLKFRLGYLKADDRYRFMAACETINSSPLWIDDSSNISLVEITARAHALKVKHGLAMMVIDYLQLVAVPGAGKNSNRAQEVASVTRGLKILAGVLDVPIIALSQLRKGAPGQKPKFPELDDLKESSSISQDSDVVMGVFRPELYVKDRDDLKGVAEIGIMKQRNGPIGRRKFVFLKAIAKFENQFEDQDDQRSLSEE